MNARIVTAIFGRLLTAPAAAAEWDARCIAIEVPEEVLTDQVFVGKMTVRNMGSAPWRSIPYGGEPGPIPTATSWTSPRCSAIA